MKPFTARPRPIITKAALLFAVAALLPLSAHAQIQARSGTFTDPRDGRAYRTRVVGSQTWMVENLGYRTGQSWCYGGDESNCAKYGRLYDWGTAVEACPSGWHLPTGGEWGLLVDAEGGKGGAGRKLKSTSGWEGGGNGVDEGGFLALPGGRRAADGGFGHAGGYGFWWSATEDGGGSAYSLSMQFYGNSVDENSNPKGNGNSVRCVKNGGPVPKEPVRKPTPQMAPQPASAPKPASAPAPTPAPQPASAPAPAVAQEKHKVAVYMSGENQTSESQIVGAELSIALTKSSSFTATERTSSFRSIFAHEKDSQKSGAVDDAQIAELGKSSGARYVCVAEVVDLSKYFTNTKESMITARIINVENAVIEGSGYLINAIAGEDAFCNASGVLVKDLIADFERRGKEKAKEIAAIYAASSDNAVVERILKPLLTHAVSRSGKYAVTERTGSFVKTLSEELKTQYSGKVDDNDLARLGRNAGAKYVIAISAVGAYFNVRIIDVKTADIINSEQKRIDFTNIKTIEKSSSELIKLFLDG